MQELKKILEEIDETIERYGKNPYIDEKSNRSLLWNENSKRYHPQAHG